MLIIVTWRELCTVDRDGVSIRLKSLHMTGERREREERVRERENERERERGERGEREGRKESVERERGEDLQVPSEGYCQLSTT